MLGYLPVKFKYAGGGVDLTPAAEEAAAVENKVRTAILVFDACRNNPFTRSMGRRRGSP